MGKYSYLYQNIKEAHNFSVMAGHSYQIEQYDGFRVTGRNATSDYIGANNMAIFLDHETERPFGYKNENILAALFREQLMITKVNICFPQVSDGKVHPNSD